MPTNAKTCVICGSGDTTPVFIKDGFQLGRCSKCGLTFVTNPPTSSELDKLYSFDQGYHSNFASPAADMLPQVSAARRHLRDLARFRTEGKLLDVGCSVGVFLNEARNSGWVVSGVERSSDSARVGRERFGLDIIAGELTEDTFGDDAFDVITMWDVIEHFENPLSALKIVARVLKDDGVLLMETPNIDGLFPRLSYKLAHKLDYWPHPEPPGHLFQFSKRSVSRLLESAGLRAVYIGDRRIPLSYSFGRPRDLLQSPKRLAYAVAFAPFAAVGPMVRQGDSLVVAAVKH
jgi:SAM-dependent methyltransferase